VNRRKPEFDEPMQPSAQPMPDSDDRQEAQPLTGEPVHAMRLRPEPPSVTRLSRKALIALGAAAASASAAR
jgi:hypothetical protein